MSQIISSLVAQIVFLIYVGSKALKTDTITDTRIIWNGFGDKQPVPADKAALLLRHPDVWVTQEQFDAGVSSGKYKPRKFADLDVDPNSDDIDLDAALEGLEDDDGEEGDASVIAKIQEYILSIDTDKPPKVDAVRAAIPGVEIGVKDVNQAWKELNGG